MPPVKPLVPAPVTGVPPVVRSATPASAVVSATAQVRGSVVPKAGHAAVGNLTPSYAQSVTPSCAIGGDMVVIVEENPSVGLLATPNPTRGIGRFAPSHVDFSFLPAEARSAAQSSFEAVINLLRGRKILPKAVLFDIDGTLLSQSGRDLSGRAIGVAFALHRVGIPVGIYSTRTMHAVSQFLTEYPAIARVFTGKLSGKPQIFGNLFRVQQADLFDSLGPTVDVVYERTQSKVDPSQTMISPRVRIAVETIHMPKFVPEEGVILIDDEDMTARYSRIRKLLGENLPANHPLAAALGLSERFFWHMTETPTSVFLADGNVARLRQILDGMDGVRTFPRTAGELVAQSERLLSEIATLRSAGKIEVIKQLFNLVDNMWSEHLRRLHEIAAAPSIQFARDIVSVSMERMNLAIEHWQRLIDACRSGLPQQESKMAGMFYSSQSQVMSNFRNYYVQHTLGVFAKVLAGGLDPRNLGFVKTPASATASVRVGDGVAVVSKSRFELADIFLSAFRRKESVVRWNPDGSLEITDVPGWRIDLKAHQLFHDLNWPADLDRPDIREALEVLGWTVAVRGNGDGTATVHINFGQTKVEDE